MKETSSTAANHHKEKRKRISRQRRSLSYAVSLHIRTSPVAINIAAITIKFRRCSVFFPRGGTYFTHYILCIGLHGNDDTRVRYAPLVCITSRRTEGIDIAIPGGHGIHGASL